jgi:hypothetical protein
MKKNTTLVNCVLLRLTGEYSEWVEHSYRKQKLESENLRILDIIL